MDDSADLWDPPTLDTEPDEPDDGPSSLRDALVGVIKAARVRLGWTVERLADESGYGRKAVSRVLNGHRAPMATLERLMRALRIEDEVVERIETPDHDDCDRDAR